MCTSQILLVPELVPTGNTWVVFHVWGGGDILDFCRIENHLGVIFLRVKPPIARAG
jgi:hypothetical protein